MNARDTRSGASHAGRPKNPKPIIGDAFADWSGINSDFMHLPGGGTLGFDPAKLTLDDFRRMSKHYQISSSLHVLTFMLHQMDYTLEDGGAKETTWCEINMESIWTRLVRSLSSAFTFGYSANAIEWENDANEGKLRLNKIKDLLPEECEVNWKYVESAIKKDNVHAPKVPIFDGIRKRGTNHAIPVSNSLWYPLLMRNGNYYGERLLETAFQPWFFSSLIHLYQNKYFERFGEPVPVGRAPYNDKVKKDDKTIYGYDLMAGILQNLRSRSSVVLPNTRSREGLNDQPEFDYQIEYLESQMRGADFERYLTRLDEEMSLALFTPLLLLRTADSGGFNQGIAHTQVFQWMLNAVAGDWAEYINKYILRPMAVYNFGPKAKPPKIKFRKLGVAQQETLRAVVQALLQRGEIKVDVNELGHHIGMTLEEVEVVKELPGEGDVDPDEDEGDLPNGNKDKRVGRPDKLKSDDLKPGSTTKQVTQRINDQIIRAYRRDSLDEWEPTPGYRRRLIAELQANGHSNPQGAAMTFNGVVINMMKDLAELGKSKYPTSGAMCDVAERLIEAEGERLYGSA